MRHAERPLVGMERVFYELKKTRGSTINVAFVLELQESLELRQLQDALGQLQRTHALLRAMIVDEGSNPLLRVSKSFPSIPVEEVRHLAVDDVVARALNDPFGALGDLMVRVAWIPRVAEGRDVLVLTLDHIIIDTKSGIGLVRELMAALEHSDAVILPSHDVELLPAPCRWLRRPPWSERVRATTSLMNQQLRFVRSAHGVLPGDVTPIGQRRGVHASVSLGLELTRSLVEGCKAQSGRTTMTGALGAALLVALQQCAGVSGPRVESLKCVTIVDMRPFVDPGCQDAAAGGLGACIGNLMGVFTGVDDLPFWELARRYSELLGAGLSSGHHLASVGLMDSVSRILGGARLCTAIEHGFRTTAVLSNVGVVSDIPGVLSFQFLTTVVDLGPGACMLTASTHRGRLSVCLVMPDFLTLDVEFVLESIANVLTGAVLQA